MAFLKKPFQWLNIGKVPSNAKIAQGWLIGEEPEADHFNNFANADYQSITELQDYALDTRGDLMEGQFTQIVQNVSNNPQIKITYDSRSNTFNDSLLAWGVKIGTAKTIASTDMFELHMSGLLWDATDVVYGSAFDLRIRLALSDNTSSGLGFVLAQCGTSGFQEMGVESIHLWRDGNRNLYVMFGNDDERKFKNVNVIMNSITSMPDMAGNFEFVLGKPAEASINLGDLPMPYGVTPTPEPVPVADLMIYVSESTGSTSGDGSLSSPVQTWRNAIDLMAENILEDRETLITLEDGAFLPVSPYIASIQVSSLPDTKLTVAGNKTTVLPLTADFGSCKEIELQNLTVSSLYSHTIDKMRVVNCDFHQITNQSSIRIEVMNSVWYKTDVAFTLRLMSEFVGDATTWVFSNCTIKSGSEGLLSITVEEGQTAIFQNSPDLASVATSVNGGIIQIL